MFPPEMALTRVEMWEVLKNTYQRKFMTCPWLGWTVNLNFAGNA